LLLFLAYAARISGGDRHLLQMAAGWRDHVDLAVVAPPRAADTVREYLGDVQVKELGSSPPIGPLLALEYIRRSITAFVRELPPADVALAASHFTPDAAGLTALVRRGSFGVGYVYHLVGARSERSLRTLWSRNDERVGLALLQRHAELVFASNEPTAAALSKRGFDPSRTDVGVDLELLSARDHERVPDQALFLGRMMPSKGARDAVETWAKVHAKLPEAKLVMAGEGPEREPAIELARSLGVAERIEWRGFVSEAEKRRLLQESSLLLAPSYEEGWGIAVCEALASGLPVVAYNLPTLNELFPDSYLDSPVGDRSGLAEAAIRVLQEPTLADSLSRRGEETATRYDVTRVAEQELEEILRRRSSRPYTSPATRV
jgi:glycosyltransferase involved in cell wall biosynthesis